MSAPTTIPPPARTWRDIPQNIAPRAMSTEGRKRMAFATFKSVLALAVVCTLAWAGYELFRTWEQDPTKLKAPVKSAPVKMPPKLRTDGVLTQEWVVQTLALPKGIDLMAIDLYAMRERLLATHQVRNAVISRKFPDMLDVVLEERTPVAKIMIQNGNRPAEVQLVARDGIIFTGTGYDADFLKRLPWLDGVSLRRSGNGLAPINGMETVADLLGTARGNVPELYKLWQVVSLARFAADGEIVVTAKDADLTKEVIFGIRDDFYTQIAQLDLIEEEARAHPERGRLRSVNLAVGLTVGGRQVPTTFQPATVLPANDNVKPIATNVSAHIPAHAGAGAISSLREPPRRPEPSFNPQRNSHRDF
jgi:hypothetical protein